MFCLQFPIASIAILEHVDPKMSKDVTFIMKFWNFYLVIYFNFLMIN